MTQLDMFCVVNIFYLLSNKSDSILRFLDIFALFCILSPVLIHIKYIQSIDLTFSHMLLYTFFANLHLLLKYNCSIRVLWCYSESIQNCTSLVLRKENKKL